ncbi:hypothetical protein ACOMHN_056344 [Nucella lapillus]
MCVKVMGTTPHHVCAGYGDHTTPCVCRLWGPHRVCAGYGDHTMCVQVMGTTPCYGDRSGAGRAGCVELLNTVVQRVKPLYHVFGHIHGEYGMWTNNTTTFINAAICDHLYHDVNPPIVFDCRLPASHTRQDFASITTQSLLQARATQANAAQA